MLFCFLYLNLLLSLILPSVFGIVCSENVCLYTPTMISLLNIHSYLSLAYLLGMIMYTIEKGWDFFSWLLSLFRSTTNNL